MREPSKPADRWAWWEAAVNGDAPPTYEDEPQAGFYKLRKFAYGKWATGPYVPARIWWEAPEVDLETGELMAPEVCRAEIDGKPKDAWRVWTWLAKKPITEAEWRWLKAQSPLLPDKIPEKPRAR